MDQVELVNGVTRRVSGTYTEWEGVVTDGTTISSMILRTGTDQNYPAGATSRVYIPVASARENRLVDGITTQHKQDGTHAAVTADSVTTDTISATSTNHLSLSAGTNKLVKTTVLRQDDTTNAYKVGNSVTLTGWGFMIPGTNAFATEAITFGVTFLQRPIVTISYGGDNASASTYGSGAATFKAAIASARSITSTGFQAGINSIDGTAWAAGNTIFYQWIAVGEI